MLKNALFAALLAAPLAAGPLAAGPLSSSLDLPSYFKPPALCERWGAVGFFATADADDVGICLASGADPLARHRPSGKTALEVAVQDGAAIGALELLLKPLARDEEAGAALSSALLEAVEAGRSLATIRLLLDHGADPNAWGEFSALHAAIASEHRHKAAIVRALLEAGADPDKNARLGSEPVLQANRLPEDADPFDPFVDTGFGRSPGLVARYVGPIPVSWGCSGYSLSPDRRTRSALQLALERGSSAAIVEMLLKSGADVSLGPEHPVFNALHLAAMQSGDPMIVRMIAEAGADIHEADERGYRAIHLAALHNDSPAVMRTLLALGADPGALHESRERQCGYQLYSLGLIAGVDFPVETLLRTPLDMAWERNSDSEVAAVLEEAGGTPFFGPAALAPAQKL